MLPQLELFPQECPVHVRTVRTGPVLAIDSGPDAARVGSGIQGDTTRAQNAKCISGNGLDRFFPWNSEAVSRCDEVPTARRRLPRGFSKATGAGHPRLDEGQ